MSDVIKRNDAIIAVVAGLDSANHVPQLPIVLKLLTLDRVDSLEEEDNNSLYSKSE